MTDQPLIGNMYPTTPPSSPLDTLKAVTMRTISQLDYVLDQLGGGAYDVPEELIEFVDGIKSMQFLALAEQVPVARDELTGELRYVHPRGTVYDDGTPVVERWDDQYGITYYYPRYDGDRTTRFNAHTDWVAANRQSAATDAKFGEIISGVDWGRNDPVDG